MKISRQATSLLKTEDDDDIYIIIVSKMANLSV